MTTFFVEGKVLEILSTPTRNGGTFYRVKVEDTNENSTDLFGMGSEAPKFGEGSTITFDAEENGKFLNMVLDSLEITDLVEPKTRGANRSSRNGSRGNSRGDDDAGNSRGSRSSRSTDSGNSRGNGGGSTKGGNSYPSKGSSGAKAPAKGETNWAEKDLRAGLGFAREQAIKVLGAMLEKEAIKLPAKTDTMKLEAPTSEKMDIYLMYLDYLTARFLEQGDNYVKDGIETIYSDAADE